jgi:hypothetical protein
LSGGLKFLVVMFYIGAIALVTYGLITMLHYPYYSSYDTETPMNHFVEGDAYNYIIMAGRGAGFIILGGFIGIIGNLLNIYGLIYSKIEKRILETE